MCSGSVNFTSSNMFPLAHSVLFQRPYLSIIRNHQKKKKPQFSKLSILTKTSIGSTKFTISNQHKRSKKQRQRQKQKNSKNNQKSISRYASIKNTNKARSNSYENHIMKTSKHIDLDKFGLSYQNQDFSKMQKNTPMSRTVYKKNQINSISPLYSSLIFNSVHQNCSPPKQSKDQLKNILDRTFNVLSAYKEQCKQLRKQRDFYKKKYHKTASKLKHVQKKREKSKF